MHIIALLLPTLVFAAQTTTNHENTKSKVKALFKNASKMSTLMLEMSQVSTLVKVEKDLFRALLATIYDEFDYLKKLTSYSSVTYGPFSIHNLDVYEEDRKALLSFDKETHSLHVDIDNVEGHHEIYILENAALVKCGHNIKPLNIQRYEGVEESQQVSELGHMSVKPCFFYLQGKPKLLSAIYDLQKYLHVPPFNILDVLNGENGDRFRVQSSLNVVTVIDKQGFVSFEVNFRDPQRGAVFAEIAGEKTFFLRHFDSGDVKAFYLIEPHAQLEIDI